MWISFLIGWSLAGFSAALIVVGRRVLLRRNRRRRARWIIAMLVLHPVWWISANNGNNGYELRFWSVVATVWIAAAVGLAICWPDHAEDLPKEWRWSLSGALGGALVGWPFAAEISDHPGVTAGSNMVLATSLLCSAMIAGTLVAGELIRRRKSASNRFSFSLRTLLLLPILLAPPFVILFPVLPYQMPYSMIRPMAPFSFVVVDDTTGRPIPLAAVRLIDPRIDPDDTESLLQPEMSNASGSVPCSLPATVHGREGLLGKTEMITYDPWLLRVEAPGYQPFFTSLESEPSILADRLTARPLGLTFPPPPSVTIRLTPSTSARGAHGKHESQ